MLYANLSFGVLICQLLFAVFCGAAFYFSRTGAARSSFTILALSSIFLFTSPSVQAQAEDSTAAGEATAAAHADDRYRIGPGDVIEIRIFKKPELSRDSVRVDNSGRIRMPLVENNITAACHTEAELAEEIASRYREYIRDPQVEVFVKEFKSRPVAVIGAVDKPGLFQLERRVRLLELISFAGGPTERAGSRIQLVHSDEIARCDAAGGGSVDEIQGLRSYDLNATLKGVEGSNPYVGAGDIVSLPEANMVFVVGNVLRPIAIPLKERMTISQAIATAGGTLPDAKKSRITIQRQTKGSLSKTEIAVNLDAINKRQSEDVVLEENDIIDVPSSTGKRILHSLINVVAPTAATLPLRVVRGY
jgi:polysaccharide export outer membrane protein